MEKPEAVNVEAICEEGGMLHKIGSDEMWNQNALTAVARDYDQEEKTMPVMQAIRYYKKAIFWSLIISMCVIMEGFDTNLLGNFYAYRKKSGTMQFRFYL
jgi:SP family general alpha glucoside:H+ symporter-like MFS transporter